MKWFMVFDHLEISQCHDSIYSDCCIENKQNIFEIDFYTKNLPFSIAIL